MADCWKYRIESGGSSVESARNAGVRGSAGNRVLRSAIGPLALALLVCPLRFDTVAMDFAMSSVQAAQATPNTEEESGEDIGGYPEGSDGGKTAAPPESEKWSAEAGRFSRSAVGDRGPEAEASSSRGHLEELNGLVPVSPEQEAGLLGNWGDD